MCEHPQLRNQVRNQVKVVIERLANNEITSKEAFALLDEKNLNLPASTPLLGP